MRVRDRVHGEITLPPFLSAMATHPTFHRLDHVRQLGGCSFVYPSATHTRREHSLGVCYLAGEMGMHLKARYPHAVDDDDILCLQTAGLAHDLGHGPFSHTFEDYMHRQSMTGWCHEAVACELLEDVFRQCAADHKPFKRGSVDQHLRTVQAMIKGLDDDASITSEEFERHPCQRFLFEVVHNQKNGIDVDKWDYLCRDSFCVFGASNPLSLSRLVGAARLVRQEHPVHGTVLVLGFDESVAFEMAEMYALRARLHRQLYQHHGVVLAEALLVDLMEAIDAVAPSPEECFHALARNNARFVNFVDASILCHPLIGHAAVAPAYEKLLNWAAVTRTRSTVVLHTLPLCTRCERETELTAAFCSHCGASTATREGRALASGVEVALSCLITDGDVTQRLRTALRCDDVRVSIRDVKCGKGVPVQDPHGRVWMDYDPLRCVVFVGKDSKPTRVDSVALHAPRYRHVRTALCHVLQPHASANRLRDVDRKFIEVCADIGFLESGVHD